MAIRHPLFVLLSALLFSLGASEHAHAERLQIARESAVEAIWHIQQMHFRFRSDRTSYACGELERKVANILLALGARDDIVVDSGCFDDQFVAGAIVQVTLAAPVPATKENVRLATTFDGRDELLARMHGAQLPTAADIDRFPAAWRTIRLQRDRRVHLEQADCDLLNAMNKQVFPKLAVQVDEKTLSCTSLSARIRPHVDATALFPVEVTPLAFTNR